MHASAGSYMHRASMPIVYRPSLLAAGPTAPDEADVRLCTVLLAWVASLMVLCGVLSLRFHLSGDSAFHTKMYIIAVPTAIVLVLILLIWLLPAGTGMQALASSSAPAPARRLCACGLSDDSEGVAALPAFQFQPPHGSAVLCAVCLEDVRAGEMVRQLPACRHLFHVDCVDVWLPSHRTCPLCRCELPRRKATSTQAQQTVAVMAATPEAVLLPPV